MLVPFGSFRKVLFLFFFEEKIVEPPVVLAAGFDRKREAEVRTSGGPPGGPYREWTLRGSPQAGEGPIAWSLEASVLRFFRKERESSYEL